MAMPPLVPLGTPPKYCRRCYALLPEDPFTGKRLDHCAAACPALGRGPVSDVLAITYLTGWPLRQRIGSDIKYMKDKGEREHIPDVAGVLHRYLDANGEIIQKVWRPTLVTYVATNQKKVARRGFDHMQEIVNARPDNVRRFGIRAALAQVREDDLPAEDRQVRAEDWDVLPGVSTRGARVLLLDDTLTSGTTAASITQLLRSRGAAHVYLLVIARAIFKDDYVEVVTDLSKQSFDWNVCKLRSQLPAAARTSAQQTEAEQVSVVVRRR